MTDELPYWAGRIREERARRLWSQKTTAARLRDAADAYTRARLPEVANIQRRVRAHEAGKHYPGDMYIELYCRAFGLTRDALFGPGAGQAGSEMVSEHDAAGLVTWITASNTTDEAIGHIDASRLALAEAHTRLPPGQVLEDVACLHRQVQELLQSGRQRSRQTRELFRIDADLLAHASLLLDDVERTASARAHGEAAALCAEEAGYSPALALSAQAKTTRWLGTHQGGAKGTQFFLQSAELARRGYECSASASARTLLANQEASAAALMGDTGRARQALRNAREASLAAQADSGTSTWSCPGPRQALYELSVAIRMQDADGALLAADMADAGWAAGEPWLYGVWSLVRIGAGIAYIMKGELDAAANQVDGVLGLQPAFRISTITSYLTDLQAFITVRRFGKSGQAHDLRERIKAFTAAASPAVTGSN